MAKESKPLNMLIVLSGVCLVSAAALGYVHTATYKKIEENKNKRIEQSVYEVLPGITEYEKVASQPLVFKGLSSGGPAGYAVLSKGMGFQGNISLMVGMDYGAGSITGVAVLESVETPGLGDKIKAKDFLGQFRQKMVPKDGRVEIDTITGATISSKAVGEIVNKAIRDVKRIH